MDNANVNHTIQQIGTALVAYGTVQAQFEDNGVRAIETNSPVFLNDRITTDADGMITIIFNDTAATQLDLGRMADVLLNEDVFQEGAPTEIGDAVAEAEQIREALRAVEFDSTAAEPAVGGAGEGDEVLVGGDVDFVTSENSDAISAISGNSTASGANLDYTVDGSAEATAPDIDTLISPPEDV